MHMHRLTRDINVHMTDPRWKNLNRNRRRSVTRHPVHIQLSIALGIEQVRDPEHLRMVWVLMGGEMLLSFVSNRAVRWKVLFGPSGPERTRRQGPSGQKEKTPSK